MYVFNYVNTLYMKELANFFQFYNANQSHFKKCLWN